MLHVVRQFSQTPRHGKHAWTSSVSSTNGQYWLLSRCPITCTCWQRLELVAQLQLAHSVNGSNAGSTRHIGIVGRLCQTARTERGDGRKAVLIACSDPMSRFPKNGSIFDRIQFAPDLFVPTIGHFNFSRFVGRLCETAIRALASDTDALQSDNSSTCLQLQARRLI